MVKEICRRECTLNKEKILIIGATGQIGTELTEKLREKYGKENVIASARRYNERVGDRNLFVALDVLDYEHLQQTIEKYSITEIYHLAALLSATGEKDPLLAWDVNMNGLLNVLETAREKNTQVFFASSMGVYGQTSPRDHTPQHCVIEPDTVYGISKISGEMWCKYYFNTYGVDVRTIRFPGLIGYKSDPGGGTTDYAVYIFYKAIENGKYECFLSENTLLPMMYMPDAIRATIELMEAPSEKIKTRMGYNLSGMSFSPAEIAEEIKNYIPDFVITYNPDERQKIADGWPQSIDDSVARDEWGWKPEWNLERMVADMILNIRKMS